MDKKKFLMEVKIYYKGLLSKENDIGHLTLELLIEIFILTPTIIINLD